MTSTETDELQIQTVTTEHSSAWPRAREEIGANNEIHVSSRSLCHLIPLSFVACIITDMT
jgi:hypothetical protein